MFNCGQGLGASLPDNQVTGGREINCSGERAPNSAPAPVHAVSERHRAYRSGAVAATIGPRMDGSPPPDRGTVMGDAELVPGETGGVHYNR